MLFHVLVEGWPSEELTAKASAEHQPNSHPFLLLLFLAASMGDAAAKRPSDCVRTHHIYSLIIPQYQVLANNFPQSNYLERFWM